MLNADNIAVALGVMGAVLAVLGFVMSAWAYESENRIVIAAAVVITTLALAAFTASVAMPSSKQLAYSLVIPNDVIADSPTDKAMKAAARTAVAFVLENHERRKQRY